MLSFNANFQQQEQCIPLCFEDHSSITVYFRADKNLPIVFKSSDQSINTDFKCLQQITVIGDVEHYEGSYDITPLITSQILPTNQKFMDDDVKIEMIPTHEIYNSSGGVTFIVG